VSALPHASGFAATKGRLLVIAGVVALLLAFAAHASAWEFLCDDAYISFRYARHLADHGVLEYNLGERVEGYTNFLWVVLLAAGQLLSWAPEKLAPVLTTLASVTGLGLSVYVVRELRGRRDQAWKLGDLLPAACLVVTPSYMVWAHGGLETSLAATGVLAAILAWLRGNLVVAAGLAGAAILTRPDSAVAIASFGLAWVAHNLIVQISSSPRPPILGQIPVRRLALATALFVAIVGGHFLWRYGYYGRWLPNTWAIKAHGTLLRSTHGGPYLTNWLTDLGLVYALPLALMIRVRHLVLAVPIVAMAAYSWSVGGDFMAHSRLLITATALTGCLGAWLLGDLGRSIATLAKRWGTRGRYIYLALSVALLACVLATMARSASHTWTRDRQTPEGWLDGRYEGVTAMQRFAAVRVKVGTWMAANLPPQTRVTVGAAGALPYASDLPTIDAYDLDDHHLARLPGLRPATGPRARPGHQIRAPRAHILAQKPDLLCHLGVVSRRRPGRRDARRRIGPGYTWACIAPGPIADPSEPDGTYAFGHYCCLRRVDHPVGPFE